MKNFILKKLIFLWTLYLLTPLVENKNIKPKNSDTNLDKLPTKSEKYSTISNSEETETPKNPAEDDAEKADTPIEKKEFAPALKKRFLLDAKVEELVFCGEDFQRILVLTQNGQVFHTKDFGVKWDKISTQFDSYHSKVNMNVITLIQNPNNKNQIIFVDENMENMITDNCGDDYKQLNFGKKMKDIIYHPQEKNIVMGLDNDNNFLISQDSAVTWQLVKENIKEFTFAKFSDNAYLSNKNRIFAILEEINAKNKLQKNLIYTDNFFNTTTSILENTEFFKITECCVYAKEKNGEMKIADAWGYFYTFYNLTIEDLDEKNFSEFNIIDTKNYYNTFGSMSYNYKDYELNRLMKSDYFGAHFKILENDLVCEKKLGFCDFVPIYSLNGIILINRYDKSYIESSQNLPKSRQKRYNSVKSFQDIDDFKETYISFNFGEKFTRLTAPSLNEIGTRVLCPDCFLNLHLQSSIKGFSMPKSSKSAPGLIIASGSISKYLVEEEDINEFYMGLFLSVDAGLSWKMLKRGRWLFEILDQGSLIVIAKKSKSVKTISYSFDSGNTWKDLIISDDPVEVMAITVNNENHMKKIVISAKTPKNYQRKASVITIDFGNLHERECEHDKDDLVHSDYEEWIPHTAEDNGCLDGRKPILVRKKPDRECFNKDRFVMYYIQENCLCTNDDYHCDFGYARDENGNCVIDYELGDTQFAEPDDCQDYYFLSDGYKKNNESFCVGGIEHKEIKYYCKKSKWFGFLHFGAILHFFNFGNLFSNWIFKLLLVAFIAGVIYYIKDNEFHHKILDFFEVHFEKVKNFRNYKKTNTENVYSELQQKKFVLDNNKKNIDSIFDDEDIEDENKKLENLNKN